MGIGPRGYLLKDNTGSKSNVTGLIMCHQIIKKFEFSRYNSITLS